MDIVNQFIATSLAIKIFKRDQTAFMDFKFFELYLDMTDAVIGRLQEDLNGLRKEMITKHHIDVRQINGTKYLVKGRDKNEEREYTPEELKQMTRVVMDRYLTGDKAAPFERQSGSWKMKFPHDK
ncbi:hypothetical protein [Oceanobacillus profundus]|uniref:Uncharacterized protein n=1 Tax=Oceanobacillus profundus TaxID=372463 RepID=A0A417Y9S5_9BACI|nr:hypothetical protein [Oceanobacillus profundus]RHW29442.1 hypothetical protein D1B32_21915 [Oceanobacillus profundus]